ncbi:MAG: bifunctional N(6)-L-threonylcarbamoyladenine synthase/serine/threonine protein kinase [Thermoplasmata archaeon]|nr:bifunctional N(6)-L-threonylcarbamoyladenine synthase/serine/threonine protein kinase [Thermoplasmata archaeon]MCI4358963.1 bifunctional N(6)-L-threonylcarbamoyladenine synthase/serine/threonine protein kinase [Thermoplasmata archaeon]
MVVLGIESTAHTASVGVVGDGAEILGLSSDMYHPPSGGIHPREAANHHVDLLPGLVEAALEQSGVNPRSLEAVAFAQGPGLGPCLRAGATVARVLALSWDRPLVAVNHCVAHVEIARVLSGLDDAILLYASGGNTQVISYGAGRYRVLGETLDVGIGNFLDKLWIALGGTFPGGPAIEAAARDRTNLLPLPYSVHGMDVAFSGILTAALELARRGADRADIAYSVETTAYAMLTEVTERALAHLGRQDVVLGGGVACNERLRAMVRTMVEARGGRSFAPPKRLCVDNGAMIAWTGLLGVRAGMRVDVERSAVRPRQRTDLVDVPWRDPSGR